MLSIAKDTLRKLLKSEKLAGTTQQLAKLRLEYTEAQHMLSNYVNKLSSADRIYPTILPTQASGRWSTLNPPLTNFDKRCISPSCGDKWHEKSEQCWSVRDCIIPDRDTFWVDADLDAVEARIFALKVRDAEAIDAFNNDIDIHTQTACYLFDLPAPQDRIDPHSSVVDTEWRSQVQWRGKNDTRRGIAKNFRYGTQYCIKPEAVLSIKDLEEFNLSKRQILILAKRYWLLTKKQQQVKFEHMKRIKKERIARTLYGARRVFYDSSDDTAKAGFNHEIQGTVVDYMNQVLLRIQKEYPVSYLVHNAHDGYKMAFPDIYKEEEVLTTCKTLTEGHLTMDTLTVAITATIKVIHSSPRH